MILLNISGPINAGKSTVSKLLVNAFDHAYFIEVDELLSDSEQASLKLDFRAGIQLRLERLSRILQQIIAENRYRVVVFAYPMNEHNYWQWKQLEDEHVLLKTITLAPRMDVCLQNRGERELTDWEINRIREMYSEGYHQSSYADLIIDNSTQTPHETVLTILNFINQYVEVSGGGCSGLV